jgi:serine/threonine protein kinase/tetratricopeptide (TPR) repeat protein
MKCPKCYADNPDSSRFCGNCATRLTQDGQPLSPLTKTLETPACVLSQGSLIAGKYRIIQEIGRGGMGIVYKAEDTSLDRKVAIKFLPEEMYQNPTARSRFIREAKAAAALDHPYICSIYEVGEAENRLFFAMEYVSGKTLRDRITEGPLPLKQALQIATEIVEALEIAHEKGMIHRDIKPANIMLMEKGHAKILDFGLAKLLPKPSEGELATAPIIADTTEPGMVMGTLAYMSPEQVRGQAVDHRSDIFSFGCVLYEMLTGKSAFSRSSAVETMTAILKEEPLEPTIIETSVPASLSRAIAHCLEKQPGERFQSARDLGFTLQAEARDLPALRGRSGGATIPGPIRSIAVLPLVSFSAGPEQEFFADSMTDAIITDLAKIGTLRVVSRTSVMQYKRTQKSIREIARELDVDAAVEGSVERAGDRVRIRAHLIRAATDEHIWADAYERDLEDVLVLQNEVARSIAREIHVKLTPGEQAALRSARRVDPEAYQLYLKGRYFWVKRTPESVKKAIGLFEQAISADPTYAHAYSGLADCYMSLGFSFDVGALPPNEAIPKAKAAAAKALEIAESLAEVHNPLAFIKLNYDWDFSGAETEFKRALELNPGNANAHHWYAHYLIVAGRPKDSLAESNRALELDPLSPIMSVHLGWLYYFLRDYERALDQLNKTIDLDPNYGLAYWYIGLVKGQQGAFTEALAAMKRGDELLKDNLVVKADLAHTLAVSGRKAEAVEALRSLLAVSRARYVNPFEIGLVHIGLGLIDEAFQWLNRAYEERSDLVVYLRVDPRLDPIRSDPRFQEIVHRMNFPEGHKE